MLKPQGLGQDALAGAPPGVPIFIFIVIFVFQLGACLLDCHTPRGSI